MTPEERFCEIAVASGFITETQSQKLLEDWLGMAIDGPPQCRFQDLVHQRGMMPPAQIAQVLSLCRQTQAPDLDTQLLNVALTRGMLTEAQAESARRQHERESRVAPKRLLAVLLEMRALTQAQAERLLAELSPGAASPAAHAAAPAAPAAPFSFAPTIPLPPAAPMHRSPTPPAARSPLAQSQRKTPVGVTYSAQPPRVQEPQRRAVGRSVQEVKWKMFLLEMRSLIGGLSILVVLGVIVLVLVNHLDKEKPARHDGDSGGGTTSYVPPPRTAPPPAVTPPAPPPTPPPTQAGHGTRDDVVARLQRVERPFGQARGRFATSWIELLGPPDERRVAEGGTEWWVYRCEDGRVELKVRGELTRGETLDLLEAGLFDPTGVHLPTPPELAGAPSSAAPASGAEEFDASPVVTQIGYAQEAEAQGRQSAAPLCYQAAMDQPRVAADAALCAALLREKARLEHYRDNLDGAIAAETTGALGKARQLYRAALDVDGTLQLVSAAKRFLNVPEASAGAASRKLLEKRYDDLMAHGKRAREDLHLVYALTCYEMASRIASSARCDPPLADTDAAASALADLTRLLSGKMDLGHEPPPPDPADPFGIGKGPHEPPKTGDNPPGPAPARAVQEQALNFVPNVSELSDSDLDTLYRAAQAFLALWKDRAAPTASLDDHRKGVFDADGLLGKLPEKTRSRPAVLFVQGASHYLLARGLFDEYVAKMAATANREERRRLRDLYEPMYDKELSSAAGKLAQCRRGANKHYAAAIFEDLSRAWNTDKQTALKGVSDAERDNKNLQGVSALEAELETYLTQNGMPVIPK